MVGIWSCRKAVVEIAGGLVFKAEELLEDRPDGIGCDGDVTPETFEDGHLTFSTEHMLCVDINMDEADFEVMRNESRFGPSIKDNNGATVIGVFFEYFPKCDVPWPIEFNWYRADIVVDGISVGGVGIRKKGFLGSIFSPAPSIKLITDKYVDQKLGSTNSITLNNNSEDPTRLKSSLLFGLFQKAGYPAPRCHLANVSVNGKAFGVYSHLEAVDETFLERAFGNSDGDLYEGQLVDFYENRLPRWDPKTDKTDRNYKRVRALSKALTQEDEGFLEELSEHLNIDRFITFWAMEFLLSHNDGYTQGKNNFFVYFDPNDTGRATFIPWGMNYFEPPEGDDQTFTLEDYVKAEIPRRLSGFPEIATKFKKEIDRLLLDVWQEDALLNSVDQFSIQVQSAENNPNHDIEMDRLREWINGRRREVRELMRDGLPDMSENEPAGCL